MRRLVGMKCFYIATKLVTHTLTVPLKILSNCQYFPLRKTFVLVPVHDLNFNVKYFFVNEY